MNERRVLLKSLLALPLMSSAKIASANDWPTRPLRLVVISAAGSAPDRYARYYADKLEKQLGQPVIVDNKPGANGSLATDFVINTKDDHMLLWAVSTVFAINPHIYPKTSTEPRRDLVAVASALEQGAVLVVNNDFPVRSLQDLVKLAKEKPGALSYASYGVASVSHLVMELFSDAANIKMVHVPYKQAALLDVISGQVPMVPEPTISALQQVRANKVRSIAYSGMKRLTALPDVPTFAELYPSVGEVTGIHGLWMATGTARAHVTKLNAAMERINGMQETAKMLADVGNAPISMSPEQLRDKIQSEYDRWGKVIRDKNIKME
jgi:tripartite-type tricarboxylate transporter receptor subunit TctC